MEFIFTCPLKKFHLLTGKQLALKFNVTLPHLSASFEKKFGVELEKVLIGVKANHGGRMITKNKHTVREISEILDYSDMRSFINMFRQKYGITPANQEALTPRGGGEEFVNRIRTAVGEAKDLNRDQERNKALQKESTAKVEAKLAELITLIREGHKIVKLGIDQKRWVEFGLRAAR